MLCLLPIFVSGCLQNGGVRDFCLVAEPITVSDDDHITDETAKLILKHDEKGAELCGW